MDSLPKNMDNLTKNRPEGFKGQRLYRVPPAVITRMRSRPHTCDFLVTDLGYFPITEGHRVTRRNGTNSHILILIEEGNGWLKLRGKTYRTESDQVILLPAGLAHAYGADRRRPWKIYWIHFQGSGAEALLQWAPFTKKSPIIPCTAADRLRSNFRAALATVERGYSNHSLLELSRLLIDSLTLLHPRNPPPSKNCRSQRIELVMDYMRETLERPETLARYAAHGGYSMSRFSESFKKHCGVSPMAYLTELRIQKACELLDRTELQVGEIATQLGFQDTLYFSRVFRKHTGVPPTRYRKLHVG
jgi:AraC-like DNA-binding protein